MRACVRVCDDLTVVLLNSLVAHVCAEHRSAALTDHNPMVQLVVRSVLCLDKALADLYIHLG